jgi:hypothetical protein
MHLLTLSSLLAAMLSSTSLALASDQLVPCEKFPTAAVVSLPAPVSEWARVYCTLYGHVLAPRAPWYWVLPLALSPVNIAAQIPTEAKPPSMDSFAFYFQSIDSRELIGSEAKQVDETISLTGDSYGPTRSRRFYRVDAKNHDGVIQSVVFRISTDESSGNQSLWGLLCHESCRTGTRFLGMQAKEPRR